MTDSNWNRKQCVKIANWLSKHKPEQAKLVAEWYSSGTCEVRLYAHQLDVRPEVIVCINDRIHLFLDTKQKNANVFCSCRAELYDTLKEWYLNGND